MQLLIDILLIAVGKEDVVKSTIEKESSCSCYCLFLILYLTFILIQEGGYIFDEFYDTSNYIKTDF